MFNSNLPPALLAKIPGSFTCHCGNTGVQRTPNQSHHKKSSLERKILQPLQSVIHPATFQITSPALYLLSYPDMLMSERTRKGPSPCCVKLYANGDWWKEGTAVYASQCPNTDTGRTLSLTGSRYNSSSRTVVSTIVMNGEMHPNLFFPSTIFVSKEFSNFSDMGCPKLEKEKKKNVTAGRLHSTLSKNHRLQANCTPLCRASDSLSKKISYF